MNQPLTRQQRWRREYPKRYQAHLRVQAAKLSGELVPQPCEICGVNRVDAHHDSYDHPLRVRWLCRKHHVQHHARGGL